MLAVCTFAVHNCIVTHTDRSHGVQFLLLLVRLFSYTISQKPMQLGSTNLTLKCSTMNPGNHLFWGQKVIGHSQGTKNHISLQTYAGCIRKPPRDCPAAIPCSTNRSSNTLFSLHHVQQTTNCRFFHVSIFLQSARFQTCKNGQS